MEEINTNQLTKIKQYIDQLEREQYAEYTTQQYAEAIELFFLKQQKINQQTINKFLETKHYNNPVYKNAIRKYCEYNKIKDIELPIRRGRKRKDISKKFLTEKEVLKIVKYMCEHQRNEKGLGTAILFITGLRISELLRLRLKDINYSTNQINGVGKGNVKFQFTLDADTFEWLKEHIELRKIKNHLFFGNRHSWRKFYYRVGMKVLGKKFSPHWLRRSCITHLFDRGLNLEEAKTYARHASVATTERYIQNVQEEDVKKKALEIFENSLKS